MSMFPPARPPRAGVPLRRKPSLPPIRHHLFVATGRYAPSATLDDPLFEICGRDDCAGLRRDRVHAVPEVPEHVAVDEARRIGEGGDAA